MAAAELIRNPEGPAPLRRPGSVRRTTTIETSWPEGPDRPGLMIGRGRDLLTPADRSAPIVLGEAQFRMRVTDAREILEIEVSPPHPNAANLCGGSGGKSSRNHLQAEMGDREGDLLYQLLDDFSGASLVCIWAKLLWQEITDPAAFRLLLPQIEATQDRQVDVCIGLASGSSTDRRAGDFTLLNHFTAVPDLRNPLDQEGWHDFTEASGPQSRRSRRIDLWLDGPKTIAVESSFQDSAMHPQEGRIAIHEYALAGAIDRASGELASFQPEARILPHPECPAAVIEAQRMARRPVAGFRNSVRDTLPGVLGCTHLNDVLRALADVPRLAEVLSGSAGASVARPASACL